MTKRKSEGISRRVFLTGVAAAGAARALGQVEAAAVPPSPDLAHDPLRPQFHFLPRRNWMNDPNGPIFWKGQYHLFFQYNPGAAVWGDMHWGHAVSKDMVHWRHQPVALSPTPGADGQGCFSGSAVVHNGVPTFLYTGVQAVSTGATLNDGTHTFRETQMLATVDDPEDDLDLLRWNKLETPVIAAPPASLTVTGFRDPCPWKEADGWYLVVGSGVRGVGGCALLYRSPDLHNWEYLHPLAEGKMRVLPTANGQPADPVDSGEMWECPDFFPLGDRHVLLYSTERKVYWTSGHYDPKGHTYTPEHSGLLDQGAFYAPKSFLAPGRSAQEQGRRILWGWIPETRSEAEYARAGWAGMMSLPRELTLDGDGRLRMAVAREVEQLRSNGRRDKLTAATPVTLKLPELRLELEAEIPAAARSIALRLVTGEATAWALRIERDPSGGRIVRATVNGANQSASSPKSIEFPLRESANGDVRLRLYLDGSVIESFLAGAGQHDSPAEQALTSRVYEMDPGTTRLEIGITGQASVELASWTPRPISPDRLTT